jgi:hypothetical protein
MSCEDPATPTTLGLTPPGCAESKSLSMNLSVMDPLLGRLQSACSQRERLRSDLLSSSM